ncbi:MAG TPA: PilZ domain-containing protein [Candidatus Omnitrophota bacterium]|nr:PilZ domain-containing protein [Candidatus Omnitrophota bacterium]HPD84638.1 PilZ domain-containing protein [Candidatus Omnitrophota bacterium]HRZ03496.1 PilZ domain-containing protein [Candidatus Omnitrophota bacterium]
MVIGIDDRRVFDRFMARFPVKFKDERADFGTNVFLRDVSATGAKVSTKERFLLNDKIDLLVELPDGHEPLNLSGRVAWSRPANPQTWDVGMKFDKVDFMDTQRIFKFCQ